MNQPYKLVNMLNERREVFLHCFPWLGLKMHHIPELKMRELLSDLHLLFKDHSEGESGSLQAAMPLLVPRDCSPSSKPRLPKPAGHLG